MRPYLALLLMAGGAAQAATLDLTHADALTLRPTQAVLDPTVRTAADGTRLVALTFQPTDAPALVVAPRQATWAWPTGGTLRLHVQNGMPWPVTLMVDVQSAGGRHLKTTVALDPGPPRVLSVPLAATSPRAFGMQVGPPMPFDDKGTPRIVATAVEGEVDTGHVTSVTLSMPRPAAPQTVLLGTMEDMPGTADLRAAYAGIVDRFGQFTRATWPEKVRDDADLKARAAAVPAVAHEGALDRFGGRTDLPAMKATGFFRVQKQGERWWLVSPEGHAFFSLGVNAVNHTDGRTYVQGREFMFSDLSRAKGAFAGSSDSRSDQGSQRDNGMNHGRWWDVYASNVALSLGRDDFGAAWRKRSVDRLHAWRFNTLGNWSDSGFAADKRMAYTVPILIRGDFNTVSTGYDYWGRMPDPFDPRFARAAQVAVAKATASVRDDPWLLGYFADNELAWAGQGPQGRWALAMGALAQGPDSPAKQAFLAYLHASYGDPAALGRAWGMPLATWDAVAAKGFQAPVPSEAHPAVAADYIAFLKRFAEQYFRTVADTLRKADPHHLFLGGRLAVRTPEVEEMSAKYADVTSINTYTDVPEHGFDVAAFRRWDKPVLISEFHFGSADRGPFGMGVAGVANEAERGKAYDRFVSSAAASGVVVGTHWFQYVDQPVTGRVLDGENAHIGLVGITDVPFSEFTQAVTKTNRRIGGG
jgi:hypothetical protein